MSNYAQNLKRDLLEQFKDKKNIDALVEVMGKQLDDLYFFIFQLKSQRSIKTSFGRQLDGLGQVVGLSRNEAKSMVYGVLPEGKLDDETYRKYLIYKVLKNTCNCTYSEIMKAIKMFWDDTPLKYSEKPDLPATIILDFDANKDNADSLVGIPFVKAGGVGLYVRMHTFDEHNIGIGMALQMSSVSTYSCEKPDDSIQYLTDENGYILLDENENILVL